MMEQLNTELDDVKDWLNVNKLKLNINKTKGMVIATENNYMKFLREKLAVKIDNIEIELVNSYKYLGFIVDRQMKFKEHIQYICKKVAKKIGVLSRCSSYLTVESRKLVYNTIILPHFLYGATIIYLAQQNELNRLQKLQNKAMRIILRCNRYTKIETMLQDLNWLNIRNLVKMHTLIFLHKIKLGLMPDYLCTLLTVFSQVHNHETRHNNNFYLTHKSKKTAQNSIFFRGLIEYNALPEIIKKLPLINKFKIELRIVIKN